MRACSVSQSCPTLCDPMTLCSPPGSSVHGSLQARMLEWVAISFSTQYTMLWFFLLKRTFLSIFLFKSQSRAKETVINIVSSFFFPAMPAADGIFVPRLGIKPRSQKWKHQVLTTGLSENSLFYFLNQMNDLSVSF